MTDLNQVVLRGRITKDASEGKKVSKSGVAYGAFSICLNRSKKVDDSWKDIAHFVEIKALGKAYDSATKYMKKGSYVCVVGHLEQDRWEDDNGKTKTKLVVMADTIYPTYPPKSKSDDDYPDDSSDSGSSQGFKDEDIPF